MHYISVKVYRRGGEVEATPVLPSDEADKLASESAGLSNGGVLGTRSGLPICTPERKISVRNQIITYFNTSIFTPITALSDTVVVEEMDLLNVLSLC